MPYSGLSEPVIEENFEIGPDGLDLSLLKLYILKEATRQGPISNGPGLLVTSTRSLDLVTSLSRFRGFNRF